MPERFWQELSAAACKADARVVMERYADAVRALDESTREDVLAQAQEIIAELPD
jgi:hypothetical protein